MKHLFDFGLSQDDITSEYRALDIEKGDRLLCVASAGEIPLNMLTLEDIRIDAVDISINQIYLSRLKLNALRSLEPLDAAAFIGFIESDPEKQLKYFKKVSELMEEDEKLFWLQNFDSIKSGPIHTARFEKYISRFNPIALRVVGKKKLFQLFELDSIEKQQDYFDNNFNTRILNTIFKIAFHPRIYTNRGLSSDGLIHSGERNIAKFFFSRFRDFCCGTLARNNYYLQFSFFNKVLFDEALPEYLTEQGVSQIRKNFTKLTFRNQSYYQVVKESQGGEFNKFALSNLSDWMDMAEFSDLLLMIKEKADSPSRLLSRYIHFNYPIVGDLANYFIPDYNSGDLLVHEDRYPFYSLVPITFERTDFADSNP